jgi:uncharacterized RDD family membrane protein YckC
MFASNLGPSTTPVALSMHEYVTGYDGHALAPLTRRVLAWLFDALLGLGLAACFVSLVGGAGDLSTVWHLLAFKSVTGTTGHRLSAAMHPGQLSVLRPILGLLAILTVIAVASVAYRVVTTALWGAGIGKSLFGLQIVVDQSDASTPVAPGWARSWKRWVVPQGPGLIPLPATGLLAYLPAFRDTRRRGLHDRVAGTVVIDVRAPSRTAHQTDWINREPVNFYG